MTKRRLLLAEDNPDDVELTMYALRDIQVEFDLTVVRDGKEALEYLFCTGRYATRDASEQPHLFLLDLNMPKLGGLEVLRQLRQAPQTKRIPVVALTTSDEETDRINGYELGVNSYIRKPVDFEKFVATIKDLGIYWLVQNLPAPN